MASVAATIALNIVSNFATDVLKWAAGESISPISEAIRSTGALFPEIDGVEDTLKQWLVHTRVTDVLNDYIAGQVGANELPLRDLVSILLEKTQFYLPEHSRATAEKIVGIFLTKLRTTYFADLQTGILHLANRGEAYASQQQAQLTAVQQQMQQLTDELKTASGLKPSLQKHFEAAAVALDRGDYPTAKALFESLLTEVEIAPQRDLDLQRRVEVNLGKIASGLGDHVGAVAYYKRAAKIDTDRVRAAVNESVADLLGLRPQDALERLNKVESADVPLSYEFWAVKVNALLGLGQFDTALNVASSIDASGKETQRFELLGCVYRNAGKLDEAESHLRNAIRLDSSRPEIKLLLAEVLFTPALDYHKQHPGRPFSTDLADKVNEAATHLESAAKTLKEQGRFTHARGAEANLAMIRGLQGRFRESIQLLEPIVVSPEATAVNWSNLGFAYLSVGESSKAAEALRHAMGNDGDINTQLMFVQALNVAGQGERALEFCSQKATEPITRENLPWHLAKANALSATRRYSKARQVLGLVQQEFPNHAEVLLNLAELQEATANYAEAEATYEQALQNATGLIELRTRYEYGGFCLNQKEYSRAVELWRPLIRRENPNTLLEYYLAALYHSRFLSEAASIAADVKAKRAKPSALFAEIASSVYERLDDLREARHWLEYLCDISGNKPKYIAQLSAVHLRLGAREQALELLDATRPYLKSAADFMSLAQAYSILGKHRQAIELAHKAVSLATDPAIHMAYLSVFMAAKECEPRTAEEIATFQDIMLNFKQRFPKSSQLQSFSIDPENPLATIRETLIKHSERVKTALQLYKERRLPLAMFARFIGKDIHDTWLSVVASPELVLHSATGTHEEAAGFARLLATGSGFVFEPVALFSFTLLGLLDKLPAIGDVYVAQRVLDLLHGLQAKRRIGSPSGTIGMIDGQFFMTEIAPDDITKQNAALDATTVWVETCAVPVGLKEPLKRADRKWLRLLGVPNVATIVIANQRGFVLVTDDKTLGDISKQNFGVSYVNTQAVLSYLLDRGVLCAEEYDRAVLSLVEHGYTFTRLHAHQILGVIAGEHFQLTPRLKRVLGALESPPADLISVSIVVADVIRQLYLEPIPDDIRNRLAFYMLDTIAKHQTKLEVQRLVRRSLRQQMSPLLMYQYKKIENLLDRL